MVKTIMEETHDTCPTCGGSGHESTWGSTATLGTCRRCGGGGRVLVKTVTRTESVEVDDLADAIARRITKTLWQTRVYPSSAPAVAQSANQPGVPRREDPSSESPF